VTVFFGLSGAMVPAGLRKVIVDMMENNLIDVLVSTGANLFHDYAEAYGSSHFIGHHSADDDRLRELEIDRIYDTFADEEKFQALNSYLLKVFESLEPKGYSSREFLEILGRSLDDGDSILAKAAELGIPVFCPALNDSSIGISLTEYYVKRKKASKPYATIDPIRGVYEVSQIKKLSKKTGVVYIGGGTPKNYIQQIEIVLDMLGRVSGRRKGHDYALQITTDDPKWGGLSGCTLKEAQSWGKIARNASKATCYVDATIGLPLIAGAIMQDSKLTNSRERLRFNWKEEELESLD
ncbi:MAG: deoxyhypusine synthase family protein, partial [Candidatus Hydrothermarchaeales archaeon]